MSEQLFILILYLGFCYTIVRLVCYPTAAADNDEPKRSTIQHTRHVTPLRLSQARRHARRHGQSS